MVRDSGRASGTTTTPAAGLKIRPRSLTRVTPRRAATMARAVAELSTRWRMRGSNPAVRHAVRTRAPSRSRARK